MATKTENLQLWKWAKTDPVDVEQINDNFGKVDTYLGKTGALEKVAEFTVQSAAAEVDFNLSSLNLSSYSAIQLYFDLKFVNSDATNARIKYNDGTPIYEMMVDNSSSGHSEPDMSITLNRINPAYGIGAKVELYQCGNSTIGLHQGMGFAHDNSGFNGCLKNMMLTEIALTELNKITLSFDEDYSNQYAVGSVLRVYGVKK